MGGSFEQMVRDAGQSSSHRSAIDVSPDAPPQPRVRSLLRSAPAVVLFAIVLADAMRSADTDLWGHLHFGNIVLTQHQLFFHAPSSYACPPGPRDWILVDWLGEAVMALVYNVAGVVGMKLAKFAMRRGGDGASVARNGRDWRGDGSPGSRAAGGRVRTHPAHAASHLPRRRCLSRRVDGDARARELRPARAAMARRADARVVGQSAWRILRRPGRDGSLYGGPRRTGPGARQRDARYGEARGADFGGDARDLAQSLWTERLDRDRRRAAQSVHATSYLRVSPAAGGDG